jgi:hypothetical protein
MRLIHYGHFAGMCTVTVDGKFYQLPTVIDLDSHYGRSRFNGKKYDDLGFQHVEQSTDLSQMRDFRDQHFYKLGQQLAKL